MWSTYVLRLIKVLWILVVLAGAILSTLIWLDVPWLPGFVRNFDWWRGLFIPAGLELARRLWLLLRRFDVYCRERERLERGENTGNSLVQRHILKICRTPSSSLPFSAAVLKLQWATDETYSEDEAAWLYGSRLAARMFQKAAKAATAKGRKTPVPQLSSTPLLHAFLWAMNELSSKFDQLVGKKQKWVVVAACEDTAPVVCIRFFLLPPAMLALFLNPEFCTSLYVDEPWHMYRVIALHIIACQVFNHNCAEGKTGSYRYAVRTFRLQTDSPVNWWDKQWSVDPRICGSEEALRKGKVLAAHLESLREAAGDEDELDPAHSVLEQPDFLTALTQATNNAAEIASAQKC